MSRIKEPSIEELQLRIDELEKSHNTYSEVIDTFTNGYVMDLISSNIRKGSSILGVVGTYAASSTASDIYKAQYAGNISSG